MKDALLMKFLHRAISIAKIAHINQIFSKFTENYLYVRTKYIVSMVFINLQTQTRVGNANVNIKTKHQTISCGY